MMYYKVALALDIEDYGKIAEEVKAVADKMAIDISRTMETPDNTYVCLFWDCIAWDMPEVSPLLKKLETMRHALITISEDHEVWKDIAVSDARGCDEEFYEILDVDTTICFWDKENPLVEEPISRERLLKLLKSHINFDACLSSESHDLYVKMSKHIGLTDKEIEILGYGCCIPDTSETDKWNLSEGDRVRLIHMDDKYAPEPGVKGTVLYTDDAKTIHVKWDTGSTLGLIPGVDQFEILSKKEVRP